MSTKADILVSKYYYKAKWHWLCNCWRACL